MTKFATRSRTIPLALALTVLTPMTLFAEAPMTARQMLAQAQNQAQNQALTAPSEIKKVEPDQSKPAQPTADAGQAGRKPVVIAAAPETPVLTVPAEPVAPTSSPTPDAAKPAPPSIASIVVLPAPSAATSAAPGTVAKPVSTSITATPAPETQTRATQSAPPSATTAAETPPQRPAAASAPGMSKVARAQTTTNEKVASKRARASRSGDSFTVSRSSINAQIGRIMQRPDVKSLLAQYGAD